MKKINKTKETKIIIENTITKEPNLFDKLDKLVFPTNKIKDTFKGNDKGINPQRLIKRFEKKIKNHYIDKSNKLLKYKIYNLSSIVNKNTGGKVFNLNNFKEYYSFSKGYISDKTLIIDDPNGNYLKGIDNIEMKKNHSKVRYFEYINNKINKNGEKLRRPLFITFTNNTQHHFFKQKSEEDTTYIHNKHCKNINFEDTILESLINQVKIWKYFFKNLKTQLKRNGLSSKVDFVRVLEQTKGHSNLHSHIILWCDNNEEDINIIKKSFYQTIRKFKLYKCDFQIVEDNVDILNEKNRKLNQKNKSKKYYKKKKMYKKVKSPSSYITKYILKGNINHYQKYYSSYRFFSCSGFKKTTQLKINKVYNYLSKFKPQLMEIFKKSTLPLYFTLELYMGKNISFTYDMTIIKTINIKKVNKKIEELTILKGKNWELVHSLEKIEDPIIFMNKIHQSDLNKKVKEKIKDLYIGISPLLSFLINEEIIDNLLTLLKDNIILNDLNILEFIQNDINNYKQDKKSKKIKSLIDKKNNIEIRYEYEIKKETTKEDIVKEVYNG